MNNQNTTATSINDLAKVYTTNEIKTCTGQKQLNAIKALSLIDEETGCWSWGSVFKPRIEINGEYKYLSRLSYGAANGGIEQNRYIENTCGNKLCINPEHHKLSTANHSHKGNRYKKAKRSDRKKTTPKLTLKQAQAILDDPRTHKVIATDYGLTILSVGNIKRGKTWKQLKRPKECKPKAAQKKANSLISWLKHPKIPTIHWSK